MHYIAATLALAVTLLMAGCGQMGPLYEPEGSTAAPATATATATATAPTTTTP